MSLTKEQKEKKNQMVGEMNFWGWTVSKYWTFLYLSVRYEKMVEFIRSERDNLKKYPNHIQHMQDFLYSAFVSPSEVKIFCYGEHLKEKSFLVLDACIKAKKLKEFKDVHELMLFRLYLSPPLSEVEYNARFFPIPEGFDPVPFIEESIFRAMIIDDYDYHLERFGKRLNFRDI